MSSDTPPVVELREDVSYPVADIVDTIRNQWPSSFSRDSMGEDILRFFEGLAQTFGAFERELYPELDVEAPPPHVELAANRVNIGQWIGWFELHSETLGSPVLFSTVPKVGFEAFNRMWNEVLEMIRSLGLPTVRVLWKNLLGDTSPTATLSHSYMLSRLTELSILEGMPRTAVTERFVAESLLGTPDVLGTAREQSRGRPYVVSRRVKVAPAALPMLLLVKFNLLVLRDLERWRRDFAPHDGLRPLVEMMNRLSLPHRLFLGEEDSLALIDWATDIDLESPDAFEQLRASFRRNDWLRRVADQYEVYLNQGRVGQYLLDRNRSNLPVQPIPSSKLYEVWTLRLVLESLLQQRGLRWADIRSRETPTERGSVLNLDGVQVGYNVDDPSWSYILGRLHRSVRPDLMISRHGGRAVVDAKYRRWDDVAAADLERLLAYLVDYSQPQKEDEIKGFLIVLSHEAGFLKLGERADLNPKIRLFSVVADPRQPEQASGNIDRMCEMITA